jgi:hypothetical protein
MEVHSHEGDYGDLTGHHFDDTSAYGHQGYDSSTALDHPVGSDSWDSPAGYGGQEYSTPDPSGTYAEIHILDHSGDDVVTTGADGSVNIYDPSGDDYITGLSADGSTQVLVGGSSDAGSVAGTTDAGSVAGTTDAGSVAGPDTVAQTDPSSYGDPSGYGSAVGSDAAVGGYAPALDAAAGYSSIGNLGPVGPMLDQTDLLSHQVAALEHQIDAGLPPADPVEAGGLGDGFLPDPSVLPVSADTAALMNQINGQMHVAQGLVDGAEHQTAQDPAAAGGYGIDQAFADSGIAPGSISPSVLNQLRMNEAIMHNPAGAARIAPLIEGDIHQTQVETSIAQYNQSIATDNEISAATDPF